MISKNQINNKEYEIPNILDDSVSIENFLDKNKSKPVVVVQGLGFVGAVMSIVCANAINQEYAVIGVDLPTKNSFWRIKSINEGVFPVISSDLKIEEYYQLSRKKNNFLATYDSLAYSKADVIIVDINLDVQKDKKLNGDLESFGVDLNPFKKAISAIAHNCKEDVLILIETTVPPGTTEHIVKPIIEENFIRRGLSISKYKLGHSYERVMPGPDYIDSIQNFYRVYSGINERSADSVELFLKTIISTKKYPLTRLGNTNSTEIAKVLENSYRAMNISFMVEWSRFAEESKVNLYEVVNAIRMRPTHNNLMLPGIGVGGYCLTKDPLMASWSKKEIFGSMSGLEKSENGVETNDKMPLYAYNSMLRFFNFKNLKNKSILCLGVSYRSDVGDTRYTPVESFYNYLIRDKCSVTLHDPYVKYWEELKLEINQSIEDVFNYQFDIVVFTTAHKEYKKSKNLINHLYSQKRLKIFDTVGILSNEEIRHLQNKHSVFVLGRGDL